MIYQERRLNILPVGDLAFQEFNRISKRAKPLVSMALMPYSQSPEVIAFVTFYASMRKMALDYFDGGPTQSIPSDNAFCEFLRSIRIDAELAMRKHLPKLDDVESEDFILYASLIAERLDSQEPDQEEIESLVAVMNSLLPTASTQEAAGI